MISAQRISTSGTGAGVALVLGSCMSLQFGAAFAVQLFPIIGAWSTTVLRLGIAAIIVLAVVRPRLRTWSRQQWKAAILFGLAMGGMNGIFFQALSLIPLGLAVSVEFAGPLLLSILLSRRKIDLLWSVLAATGLGLLGYEAFISASNINPLGVILALIAGGFWMLYILASARVGQVINGAGGLAIALAVGSIVLLPLGAGSVGLVLADSKLMLMVCAVALLSSTLPYSFELAALRRLPRNVFSILLSLEPVFAETAGFLLLRQETSPIRWVAIVLLVTASIGITRTSAPKPAQLEITYAPESHRKPA